MTEPPQSHADLHMSGRAEVWIAVEPEVAYAAVSDITRMGEWSPVNRGGEWIDGSTFRGRNGNAQGEWETIATVIEAEPGSRFAFCVAPPGEVGTIWRYTFQAEGEGTSVTEAFEWHWTPIPAEGFRGRVGLLPLADAIAAVEERRQHLQQQVESTLAALKRSLEADEL